MKKNTKLIEAHKVEVAVNIIIFLLAIFAVFVFVIALQRPGFIEQAVIIEMFIVVLIAILAQTAILTKLMERIM